MAETVRTRTPPSGETTTAPAPRLAWLDALRGIAALCVVFDHLSYYVLHQVRDVVYHWFDPGQYGVFVFFLVSGYIIPASLERKGSVRSFWVSRVFRLYPLYLLAVAGAIALWKLRIGNVAGTQNDPKTAALAHLLMMSNMLGSANVPDVVWSLSFEMTFYLLLTALFVAGWHRRSSRLALGFAVAAVVLGAALPMTALSNGVLGARLVAEIADLIIICGTVLAVVTRGLPRTIGAAGAAGTALVLLAVNGRWVYPWESLTIPALMFTGTMLYRAERGEYSWDKAIFAAAGVFGLTAVAGVWHSHIWHMSYGSEAIYETKWVVSLGLAGLTFALGLAFRNRRIPSALAWLGLISYSVYLLHPLLVEVYYHVPGTRGSHPFGIQVLMAAAFLAALIALCSVTYLLVERPMQRSGRKLARRLDERFGPDQAPARTLTPVTE